jgi:hypothetical protein
MEHPQSKCCNAISFGHLLGGKKYFNHLEPQYSDDFYHQESCKLFQSAIFCAIKNHDLDEQARSRFLLADHHCIVVLNG